MAVFGQALHKVKFRQIGTCPMSLCFNDYSKLKISFPIVHEESTSPFEDDPRKIDGE